MNRRLSGSLLALSCTAALLPLATPAHAQSRSTEVENAQQQILDLIDEIVPPERLRGLSRANQARGISPCTDLDWAVYCVGIGWLDTLPDYDSIVRAQPENAKQKGDLSYDAQVEHRATLAGPELQQVVQAELADAAAGVEKMLELESILNTPVTTPRRAKDPGEYGLIMSGYESKQVASNWCGPATFQMMEWARSGSKETQDYWGGRLGTGAPGGVGTAITAMVSLTNSATTWDNAAGTYQVVGIDSWNADQFWNAHTSQIISKGAPLIEHPQLLTAYFNHININGGGHFQVGRGISRAPGSVTRYVHFFEPWNEADWYGGGVTSWGARKVTVGKMLSATKANTDHKNIGR